MESPVSILKKFWGHDAFRPLQAEIIQSILEEKDTLALLPTGGGKSICFQVPAMCRDGICLVISPLIALMKDQVENLKQRNIMALSIYSGMSYFDVKETLQNAAYGAYKFLYVSPERLETALFKEYLPALPINLIAVDEAHCISQWGYDFRPPYLRIANLRHQLPNVPVIALTASATPMVQQDICEKLEFKTENIFRQSFEKPNLSFSVFKVDSKINKLFEVLHKVQGSAIVYCRNRKQTKEIAQLLTLQKISADYYHAGLPQKERSHKQEQWIANHTRVIVCTNAFGMGIDKPDVRVVAHMDIPDNLENYYQEAGRAGRDGKRAFAVLIHNQIELDELDKLADKKFPSVEQIRNVYQAVANHLQVAIGNGEGQYYDFNLNDFVKHFKLDIFLVINTLKALEQEGHLSFNEQVFIAAKVGFTCDKETLHAFESAHPSLENLIKYLLRAYAGIFDNLVSVSEQMLARLTNQSIEVLQQQLQQLKAFGIIVYEPQKETPQLYFLQNRAPVQHLQFNHEAYLKRKQLYSQRVQAMRHYVLLDKQCRSKYIGNYFGDMAMKNCQCCDNCLQQKALVISAGEFKALSKSIYDTLENGGLPWHLLLQKMPGIKQDKIWKVLQHLQAEGKVSVNEKGSIKRA